MNLKHVFVTERVRLSMEVIGLLKHTVVKSEGVRMMVAVDTAGESGADRCSGNGAQGIGVKGGGESVRSC